MPKRPRRKISREALVRKRRTMFMPTSFKPRRELYDYLKKRAAEQGCSMSHIIGTVLDKWMAYEQAGEKHRARMAQE